MGLLAVGLAGLCAILAVIAGLLVVAEEVRCLG